MSGALHGSRGAANNPRRASRHTDARGALVSALDPDPARGMKVRPPSALAPSLPMESALERIAIPERDKALRRKAAAAKMRLEASRLTVLVKPRPASFLPFPALNASR